MSEFNCLKIAFGDFQTPPELAREVCSFLKTQGIHPRTILEPTCGVGNFLGEAAEAWPHAHRLLGFEVNADYVARARARVQDPRAVFHVADFFATAWEKVLSGLPHPILVLGNPPWVTNAKMRSTGAANLPTKSNFQGHSGFDSITGKANFDISEWMLLKTLDWCERHQASIALLVKVSVARKVLSGAWKDQRRVGRAAIFRIDAKRWFGAAVDACLLTFFPSPAPETSCPIHPTLGSSESVVMGYKAGDVVSDIRKYEAVADLLGGSPARWRSGVKHDCSKVFEMTDAGWVLVNGHDETVAVERDLLFPLFKSSQLARGDTRTNKMVLVTQRRVGEPTDRLRTEAPLAWEYLVRHLAALDARGSSIYAKGPRFSIFGVGDYTFAPWKVAVSGLYKAPKFVALGPAEGKPALVDDTAVHLSFDSQNDAERIAHALNSKRAMDFFAVFAFSDAKRPFTVELLSKLNLAKLVEQTGGGSLRCLTREKSEVTDDLFASVVP